jgi:imidazolonepropionase-like amidohydrolase
MSEWLLIGNALLVDGRGRHDANQHVLVKDGEIVALGGSEVRAQVPRGEKLSEIDATGKTVMPGLIDAHCHMTYGEARTEEEIDLYTSVETRTLRAAHNLKQVLRAGVTSISQPGGSWNIGTALRDAVRDGIVEGPRIATAARYLSSRNSLTDWYPSWIGVPESSIGVLVRNRDEIVDEIRLQVKNGVDFVKVADSPFGEHQAFTYDEMRTATDTAHMLNVGAVIHARGNAEVNAAVRAEFDWIMHGNVMDDETIELLAASKIPLIPTLTLIANWADYGHLFGVPVKLRDPCKRLLEETAEVLHRAHAAGVTLVAGTDSGFSATPYGEWHARELELLQTYAGLSTTEAIKAGTENAGKMVGLEGRVGVLEPGALADLLVIDGDPSTDLKILLDKARIERVILGGVPVDFDDDARAIRHEAAQVMSTGYLTVDMVNGTRDQRNDGPDTSYVSWDEVEALETAYSKRESVR